MEVLTGLSKKGRTIVITIHQPSREIYEMMDNALILGVGGRLIYYGPVKDSYARFHTDPNPDALFETLTPKGMKERDWDRMEEDFKRTEWYRRFVYERSISPPSEEIIAPRARASRAPGLSQFNILFERLTKLYTRDVGWLIGSVLGAPVLILFLSTMLDETKNRHVLLFVANLLAFFFGIFPAIEMIHSERTIFLRERMVNLKIPSYILSKIVFLAVFGLFQAFSIAGVLIWYVEVDADLAPCLSTLLSVQIAGLTSGVFFSTISKTSKVALLLMLG